MVDTYLRRITQFDCHPHV